MCINNIQITMNTAFVYLLKLQQCPSPVVLKPSVLKNISVEFQTNSHFVKRFLCSLLSSHWWRRSSPQTAVMLELPIGFSCRKIDSRSFQYRSAFLSRPVTQEYLTWWLLFTLIKLYATTHTKTAVLFADCMGEYDITEFWNNFSFAKSFSFSFYLVF